LNSAHQKALHDFETWLDVVRVWQEVEESPKGLNAIDVKVD